jgi:hypothetical protein
MIKRKYPFIRNYPDHENHSCTIRPGYAGTCLSLAYWRTVHEDFFRKELTHEGKTFDEKMDIVCEEFKVVYR